MAEHMLDLDWFREALLKRQRELQELSAISSEARAAVTLDQSSVGRVSRIDAIAAAAKWHLPRKRTRERDIQRIKAALLRLDEGEFGYCVTCGEAIAEKRLRLDPGVPTCIDCAS